MRTNQKPPQPPFLQASPANETASQTAGACNRRAFVKGVFAAAAAANVAGLPLTQSAEAQPSERHSNAQPRRNEAYKIRLDMALQEKRQPLPAHPSNGDEDLYSHKIASFSKGLPHNDLGEVDRAAYGTFLRTLAEQDPEAFEFIPMGCPDPTHRYRLVNPQAGLAFDLEGADAHALAIPPAPAFSSLEQASEMLENYWMALARDIPFSEFETTPSTLAAAADLTSFTTFSRCLLVRAQSIRSTTTTP